MSTKDSGRNPLEKIKTLLGLDRVDEQTDYSSEIYHFINRLYYPLYAYVFDTRNQYVSKVERLLVQANRSEPVEIYLSAYMGIFSLISMFFGLIATGSRVVDIMHIFRLDAFYPASSYADFFVGNLIIGFGTSLTVLSIIAGFGLIGATSGVVYAVQKLKSKAKKRKKKINILLPDAIAFMYCLSTGGMNRIDILRELSMSEDIYNEVSQEFQRVIFQLDNFSNDYYTAISNVAETTPSEPLSTFLNDMLSTINSGGQMDDFLETQLEQFMDQVENTQQSELDTLEVLNEIYITLSLIPVMGIVILAFAATMGIVSAVPLVTIAYVIIPLIQVIALALIMTIFESSYGGGTLTPDPHDNFERVDDDSANIFSAGVVNEYRNGLVLFEQIYANELRNRLFSFLSNPIQFAQDNPKYVFIVTGPTSVLFFALTLMTGNLSFTTDFMIDNALRATLFGFYLPVMVLILPYLYFFEMGLYRRGKITDGLTTDLNKLANVNDKGIPLQESLYITSVDSDTQLSNEFQEIYKKLELKVPLGKAIVESNNKYRIPRLARIFRIIKSAQGISNDVTDVLKTASSLASIQEKIIKDRKSRTRQQIGIISIIFFVFIACLILMQSFITGSDAGSIGSLGGGGSPFSSSSTEPVKDELIEMIFYHGAIIQGTLAGIICGYIRTGELSPGVKYSAFFVTIVMCVWLYL